MNEYLKISIGEVDIAVNASDDLPVSIDYQLEDQENFQLKTSPQAISLIVPASLINEKVVNGIIDPGSQDFTEGKVFDNTMPCRIELNSFEVLKGKAFLKGAKYSNKGASFEFNLYGGNADWKVEIDEKTIYDCLKHINFLFTKSTIESSLSYDGQNQNTPYVFAPVRYREPMNGFKNDASTGTLIPDNSTMNPINMRPSISVYWLLYFGFKSVGYRISSKFFNTNYFRRLVMPWTWGSFTFSEGTKLDQHKFLAKGTQIAYHSFSAGTNAFPVDVFAYNDSTNGAFDNNNDYNYIPGQAYIMEWVYNPPVFGLITAAFSLSVNVDAGCNGNVSYVRLYARFFKNGQLFSNQQFVNLNGPVVGGTSDVGLKTLTTSIDVVPNDRVQCQVYAEGRSSKVGYASFSLEISEYKIDYFKIPLGGTIDFSNFTNLKKYKWLDFFRGVIDTFNLSFSTDTTSKVICVEPTHSYGLGENASLAQYEGFFNDHFIDWNSKKDYASDWEITKFSEYEQEVNIQFKNDGNDGILKTLQDRHATTLAAARYVLPKRFKSGKKDVENRFFSPVVHCDVNDWAGITGVVPQVVCIVPENVSNTSEGESGSVFLPKMCYYKGIVSGAGGWALGTIGSEGQPDRRTTYPFMFAVNYQTGGEKDPVLSYSDERIGTVGDKILNVNFRLANNFIVFVGQPNLINNFYSGQTITIANTTSNNRVVQVIAINAYVPALNSFSIEVSGVPFSTENVTNGRLSLQGNLKVATGLFKRFFWNRFAIMRNGDYRNGYFNLNQSDVAGQFHREFKVLEGQKWQLIAIREYNPLAQEPTACLLYKWVPVAKEDADNTYPSANTLLNGTTPSTSSSDIKYSQLKALPTDIPNS